MKQLALSQCWYWFVLAAVISYFIGCFNFAVLISKLKKKDVRALGSGNPGTMNMTREFGIKIGILTYLLDVLKGGVPALVAYFIFRDFVFEGTTVLVSDFARYLCGACAVIGHIYPVTMRFKGGKGIASTFGLFWFALSCEWGWNALIMVLCFFVVVLFILFTEYGSMGSLLGVSAFSFWQGVIFFLRYQFAMNGYVVALFLLLLLLNFLTWFAHRKNLVRLFAGEEHRTSLKKLSKGKRGKENM